MHRFVFTDPFELFNSLFGDFHGAFHDDPFFNDLPGHHSSFDPMFGPGSRWGGIFGHPALSPFGSQFPFGGPRPLLEMMHGGLGSSDNVRSYSSVTQAIGNGDGSWVSQSKMTRSVNGRTETIVKRRDAQGNEHVTYSSPEGKRYTINGVDQPVTSRRRHLPSADRDPAPLPRPDKHAHTSSRREHPQPQPIPDSRAPPKVIDYGALPQREASRYQESIHRETRPRHHSTHEGL